MAGIGVDRARIFIIPGSGVDAEEVSAAAGAGGTAGRRLCRAPACRQRPAGAGASPRPASRPVALPSACSLPATPTRPIRRRSRQPKSNAGARSRDLSFSATLPIWASLGTGPYRGPAVAAGRPAEEPAGGGRLRPAYRRHRRSRLPGDRPARRQCPPGPTGRRHGPCRRDRAARRRRRLTRPLRQRRPSARRGQVFQRADWTRYRLALRSSSARTGLYDTGRGRRIAVRPLQGLDKWSAA